MSSDLGIPQFHIAVPYLDDPEHRLLLRETIRSIYAQSSIQQGKARLRLTLALAGENLDLTQWLEAHLGEDFTRLNVDAAPDTSMYGALARVFRHSSADYFGWLGAGDAYESGAFEVVIENAPDNPADAFWITGLMRGRRADGIVVRSNLPFRYRRRFFERGIHGTKLPSVQQESTFWNQPLHRTIDFDQWSSYRLAGDYYLWTGFSSECEPVIVEAALGAFTWHGDNQSADYAAYQSEVRSMTLPPTILDRIAAKLDLLGWALHPALKARLSRSQVRRYGWPNGPWSGR
jgi:hypothetical protein